jgi:hypothetical protein
MMDEALVSIAGAMMKVSIPNGLLPRWSMIIRQAPLWSREDDLSTL